MEGGTHEQATARQESLNEGLSSDESAPPSGALRVEDGGCCAAT